MFKLIQYINILPETLFVKADCWYVHVLEDLYIYVYFFLLVTAMANTEKGKLLILSGVFRVESF